MKKITFYFTMLLMLTFSWQGIAQTLNQPAGWPNGGWTVTTIASGGTQDIEANPEVDENFAYDDDDTGSGSHDEIMAESPIIDLTAASAAGETLLTLSGDYVFNNIDTEEYLGADYWDADTSSWVTIIQFANADTPNPITDWYCGGTYVSYSADLDISSFTATQLSGFKYRFYYNDDVTGGTAWNWGFCFSSPTLISSIPPACPAPLGISVDSMTPPGDAIFSWNVVTAGTSYNYEIQPQGVAQGTAGAVASGNTTTTSFVATSLVSGTDYTLYVQTDCGGGTVGDWVSFNFTFLLPPVNDNMADAIPIVPSPEGTVCDATSQFTAHLEGDGTTDSGLDGTCNGTSTGLDVFYTWTATSDALVWNDGDGNPGIIIRDAAGVEITCEGTFASDDVELSGWTIGDDLIIQIYDYDTADVDVRFCLAEKTLSTIPLPDCVTLVSPADGATNVLSPVALDWDAATTGEPADSYNVYFTFNGGATQSLGNFTDTETPALPLGPDAVIVWWVVPVNDAGENTACTTSFTFSSYVGADDYDGDGIDNVTEVNGGTEMTLPCDPVQAAGYTGYDATNAIWMAADCDGDGMSNGDEAAYGSDPYDPDSNAINELAAVGFEFYPNPVNDTLTVKANENITNVAIYNMLGQQVKQVNPSSLNAQIDMSNLANGTYFIKATVGEKVGTFKIVKK